jgi:predicted YcjX-like family ATPase
MLQGNTFFGRSGVLYRKRPDWPRGQIQRFPRLEILPSLLTRFSDDARLALDTLTDRAAGFVNPTLRLGVTGLSRAGKTVFISSLVHNLLNGGRLPVFEAVRSGRVSKIRLEPQPDDAVPRFQYEDHIAALVRDRVWPDSTRAISQLRITLDYESASGWNRMFSPGRLSIDIVDYPGEWLLDLPLLTQDFRAFSNRTVERAKTGIRSELSTDWLSLATSLDIAMPAVEADAQRLAEAFTTYLQACKSDERSLSTLPPGRFLMPGDLEGSPALTFSPLANLPEGRAPKGSLWAMMERRYEAYKTHVVKPFFREHFARLDRQIVLIDALQAINRGPESLLDLEGALADVLASFRPGTNSFLSSFLTKRIDKVLIAATKADHLHHESHDRLERIAARLVQRAVDRIGISGAGLEVMAIASVRATREATVNHDGHALPVIVGTPMAAERINGETFDGERKTAIFTGDLPQNPDALFQDIESKPEESLVPDLSFVRFRPPHIEETGGGLKLSVPHIRLDRAMQFLFGDRLA